MLSLSVPKGVDNITCPIWAAIWNTIIYKVADNLGLKCSVIYLNIGSINNGTLIACTILITEIVNSVVNTPLSPILETTTQTPSNNVFLTLNLYIMIGTTPI